MVQQGPVTALGRYPTPYYRLGVLFQNSRSMYCFPGLWWRLVGHFMLPCPMPYFWLTVDCLTLTFPPREGRTRPFSSICLLLAYCVFTGLSILFQKILCYIVHFTGNTLKLSSPNLLAICRCYRCESYFIIYCLSSRLVMVSFLRPISHREKELGSKKKKKYHGG